MVNNNNEHENIIFNKISAHNFLYPNTKKRLSVTDNKRRHTFVSPIHGIFPLKKGNSTRLCPRRGCLLPFDHFVKEARELDSVAGAWG